MKISVEKGYANFELEVIGQQQHSSIPPKQSVVGVLARAVAQLEANPQPSRFGTGVEADMFAYLAPHMKFIFKMALSNLWIFRDIVSSILSRDPGTDAIQRTTTAITIVEAGFKDNVVPGEARATVNHRIHPSETLEDIVEHDKKIINDERVQFNTIRYSPPTPVSPYSNDVKQFQVIANSALQVLRYIHIVSTLSSLSSRFSPMAT